MENVKVVFVSLDYCVQMMVWTFTPLLYFECMKLFLPLLPILSLPLSSLRECPQVFAVSCSPVNNLDIWNGGDKDIFLCIFVFHIFITLHDCYCSSEVEYIWTLVARLSWMSAAASQSSSPRFPLWTFLRPQRVNKTTMPERIFLPRPE